MMLRSSGNCLLIQSLIIPGFFRKDPGSKRSAGEGLDPGRTGSTGNHSGWITVVRDEREGWECRNGGYSTCPVLQTTATTSFGRHFAPILENVGRWEPWGDSSSSQGLQAGLGQADLADILE